MLKQMLGIGLLTAVILIPTTTWAQPGPPPMMPGGGQFMDGKPPHGPHGPGMDIGRWWEHPEVQKKLGLTPEQVEKLAAQRLETETKMIEVGSKKRIAQLHLRDLVSKKDASEEEINKKVDEIGDLQKEQMKAAIGQTRAIRTILNDEQQAKVEKFLKNRQERANRGPRFRGGPDGGRDDRPWDKDGQGENGPGMDGKHGMNRGEGKGPGGPGGHGGPGGRGFGMAPEGQLDSPDMDAPGLPDAPPPGGPGFGGPVEPPMRPGAPGKALEGDDAGAPFPPEPELGWGGDNLDSGFLMGDLTSFDEPLEDILADFE